MFLWWRLSTAQRVVLLAVGIAVFGLFVPVKGSVDGTTPYSCGMPIHRSFGHFDSPDSPSRDPDADCIVESRARVAGALSLSALILILGRWILGRPSQTEAELLRPGGPGSKS